MLSSASVKAKLFVKIFSKDSNLVDLVFSLPAFPSRTYMKLRDILVTPKFIKKALPSLIHRRRPALIVFQWLV